MGEEERVSGCMWKVKTEWREAFNEERKNGNKSARRKKRRKE